MATVERHKHMMAVADLESVLCRLKIECQTWRAENTVPSFPTTVQDGVDEGRSSQLCGQGL